MLKSLKFYVTTFLVVIFVISYFLAYFFITERYEQIILQELGASARMLAQQILITRKWVALHGTVLVEKDETTEPNPFLTEPYIIDKKGRIYVKMNPAFVTREIAKLAEKEKGFYFRVVSLRAVNIKNSPDDFEKKALLQFEGNVINEIFAVKDKTFRYMIPLYTEGSCISCHRDYKVGDVRGALSIFLPSDKLFLKLKKTKFMFFLLLTLFHLVVFSGFWLFFDRFVVKPVKDLALFAEGEKKLPTNSFNIEELFVLSEKLKQAKIKDEKIKEMLKEEVAKATEELKLLNDKKSEFLLEIGHKLKTPLTVISASVDYLLLKGNCLEEEKYLELLKKNVSTLKRALNQILKTAQIDMNIKDDDFEKINISNILRDVLSTFDGKNMVLEIEDDLYIYGLKDKITLLFENLIHNAVKFSKKDGVVQVIMKREGNALIFIVKDEGIGIKDEDKPHIFEKFFHKSYNEKEKGTGLGLYIVKKVVELHNGSISFESDAGKGTTFIVNIPIEEA